MKNLILFSSLTALMLLVSCRKCSLDSDVVVPEQAIRIVDQQGNDLVFGDSAIYDIDEVVFVHERLGELPYYTNSQKQTLYMAFPPTQVGAEDITMELDSATSHLLTYNTLVFTNNECVKEYVLSYVKLDGEQVCGSCGDPAFNSDPIIYLEL